MSTKEGVTRKFRLSELTFERFKRILQTYTELVSFEKINVGTLSFVAVRDQICSRERKMIWHVRDDVSPFLFFTLVLERITKSKDPILSFYLIWDDMDRLNEEYFSKIKKQKEKIPIIFKQRAETILRKKIKKETEKTFYTEKTLLEKRSEDIVSEFLNMHSKKDAEILFDEILRREVLLKEECIKIKLPWRCREEFYLEDLLWMEYPTEEFAKAIFEVWERQIPFFSTSRLIRIMSLGKENDFYVSKKYTQKMKNIAEELFRNEAKKEDWVGLIKAYDSDIFGVPALNSQKKILKHFLLLEHPSVQDIISICANSSFFPVERDLVLVAHALWNGMKREDTLGIKETFGIHGVWGIFFKMIFEEESETLTEEEKNLIFPAFVLFLDKKSFEKIERIDKKKDFSKFYSIMRSSILRTIQEAFWEFLGKKKEQTQGDLFSSFLFGEIQHLNSMPERYLISLEEIPDREKEALMAKFLYEGILLNFKTEEKIPGLVFETAIIMKQKEEIKL